MKRYHFSAIREVITTVGHETKHIEFRRSKNVTVSNCCDSQLLVHKFLAILTNSYKNNGRYEEKGEHI